MVDTQRNTPEAASPEDQRLRVAALTALQEYVAAELAAARNELHAAMKNGESHTVWSPLDETVQIATVNRSKPKAKVPPAVVSDRAALEAWLAEHQPDAVETVEEVTGEAVEFLRDAAPELLARRTRVAEWAVDAVIQASTKARAAVHPDGTTDVPGVTIPRTEHPDGRLSVRLDDQAGEVVTELIRRNVLDQHGRRLAIEA